MRLTVLGRSPARPNPGEACAGYIVEGGRSRVMLDAGPGTVAQLLRRNTPDELDAVVISHMHTDHCLDLITLRYSYPWIDVAKKRLLVIVPPGSMAQISELALGAGYVNFFDKSFIFDEHDGKRPIEIGDLRFEPDETQHYVRTWGFRVQARGQGEDPKVRIVGHHASDLGRGSVRQPLDQRDPVIGREPVGISKRRDGLGARREEHGGDEQPPLHVISVRSRGDLEIAQEPRRDR